MLYMTNFNNSEEDMIRFGGKEDIRRFCQGHHLDGLEYMRVPDCAEDGIPFEIVYGIHLSSFQNWVDLWLGNWERLLEEFGTAECIEQFYGGTSKEALIQRFRTELDFAERKQVRYVVFHISEVNIEESVTYQSYYSDEEVVDAAAELINMLLDGKGYTFDFLMENLWWPGMNLKRPEITRRMLEKVHYPGKGIMLDTGHLLHTNWYLESQEEGVEYIHRILDAHGGLCKWIKGIHLHQSLSGKRILELQNQVIELKEDYWERYGQAFELIFAIDRHQPFTAEGIEAFVKRIEPDYLTLEFITKSRQQHERFLDIQYEALQGKNGSE